LIPDIVSNKLKMENRCIVIKSAMNYISYTSSTFLILLALFCNIFISKMLQKMIKITNLFIKKLRNILNH